ncbi:MAG: methionyl-tRNA formyltransferase [Chloroflexi bacterium]|nr:MAG: methionyl-tRNA formyltransferase [Chloroflexota bacterium]
MKLADESQGSTVQNQIDPGPVPPVRLIFMGTPDFALPSLRGLVERALPGQLWPAGLDIVAVITRPDKVAGRGREASISPVKGFALAHGLPLYQPGSLRRPEAQQLLRTLRPDLIVVAAFGQILPPEVLRLPKFGCVNVHASLLPRHRGASPIAAAILAGDQQTGASIMLMDEGLDTGPILAKQATLIDPHDTAGALFVRLADLGAKTLLRTLPLWLQGLIAPEPQDSSVATLTRILAKEDGLLDWSRAAIYLERAVRAYHPWPGAYTTWNAKTLKVLEAHVLEASVQEPPHRQPGRCFLLGESSKDRLLCCFCGDGSLALDVIQLAGKRALPSTDVLRGHPDLGSAVFGS